MIIIFTCRLAIFSGVSVFSWQKMILLVIDPIPSSPCHSYDWFSEPPLFHLKPARAAVVASWDFMAWSRLGDHRSNGSLSFFGGRNKNQPLDGMFFRLLKDQIIQMCGECPSWFLDGSSLSEINHPTGSDGTGGPYGAWSMVGNSIQ